MTKRNRSLERAAVHVLERLGEAQLEEHTVELPITAWEDCERLLKLISKAKSHGWLAAARRMRQRFDVALQAMLDRLAKLRQPHGSSGNTLSGNTCCQPTITEIYRDLQALQHEFVEVEYDRRRSQLSVTTEEIILEDLNLGPFSIVLECNRLGHLSPYQVVAIDENPAGTDSRTTHPHVQDETLCEGDGHVPIQRALEQGRLFDFFLLVRQILGTYNSGSAYVSIEDWNGITCRDCGRTVAADDRDTCTRCESDVCFECSYGCSRCSERFCDGCSEACLVCHDYYCQACLQACDKCDLLFCEDCLTNETCQKCIEKEEADEKEANPPTDTAVHSVCMGEAALSP